MKKLTPVLLASLAASCMACAAQPDENLVKSCLQVEAVVPFVSIKNFDANEISQEEKYADGFDATYMFEYRGSEIGYAESENDQALIYSGKLYRLSRAIPLGGNHGIKSGGFNPMLANWSIVREYYKRYLCVSFNFDGVGRSGDFQSVHGGYLLDTTTKFLYFAVRDIRK